LFFFCWREGAVWSGAGRGLFINITDASDPDIGVLHFLEKKKLSVSHRSASQAGDMKSVHHRAVALALILVAQTAQTLAAFGDLRRYGDINSGKCNKKVTLLQET
jgi:hypothetical protein